MRKQGLAIDNLVGARVVTADGRLVRASETENPALFWALRGGGGNLGVVVDLDFVAQPVPAVRFGSVDYCTDDTAGLLARWRDAMRAAPDDLSSTLVLPPPAPGAPVTATVLLCHAPDPGATADEDAVFPLLDLGPVANWSISERPYADVLEDAPAHPPGVRPVVRNALVRDLDEQVVAAVDRFHRGPAPAAVAVRSLGGAVARVPADATAFAHRDAEAMVVGMVPLPPTATDADVDRVLGPWRDVSALGTGAYVGFQGAAEAEDVAAVYPRATRLRLAAVKRAYDPGNLFRLNHNVPPLDPASRRTPRGPGRRRPR
ncbi:BBE domain-containing protein [Nocardioides sp. TF02-7]|uniref:BBE domain-containing protein n=1 Tax=Nocardioides sp. TF02-7 TaxID=2917724 RepID=UPI001F068B78|nr:BBE domain-containing protein [Nocardioides sp. TF02-7]UMG94002.1 BBE domain-containing protein [Nocardioides sp. TF02-7]